MLSMRASHQLREVVLQTSLEKPHRHFRWAEKARAGSNPAIGKLPELDRINKIDRIRISLIVSIL